MFIYVNFFSKIRGCLVNCIEIFKMNKLLLMILGIFIASQSVVSAVDEKQSNQSKAVPLRFKDENAVAEFNERVVEHVRR